MDMKNPETATQSDDTIFVLDIGTRSIIGLVGIVEDEKLKVIAIESADHTKRAMIDGQIEDISSVAKLATAVKERIEAKLGTALTRVCVAAAGRALKTERTTHEIDVPEGKTIDDDLINQLESGAIQKIEEMLDESAGDTYRFFHLVGYSAVQYYLDDYPISDLSGHHGSKIKADILATFLPSEVIDSLYAAMEQAGLEVASMTLEPIAAINAAIPANLRLLNLAFADIGAGTSDIAVCKDGNIAGYTMSTIAGDEVTEALMREYLIDFDTAEQIKLDLESKKEIYFTDIMGFEQTVAAEDIMDCIADSVALLSGEIAKGIVEVNGGSPSAVFLAGGGSKLKGVLEGVRDALQMDDKRIAIAGNNFKATAFSKEYDLNNPELATPLGIAVSTGLNMINDSYHLTLNGKRARLFRNGALNILNVLAMNGYQYRDLFGRSGSSMILTINGKRSVLYGEPATNCTLTLNGNPATPSELVKAGDVLEFIPAKAGEAAKAKVSDVVPQDAQDTENLVVTVNGELADFDTVLNSGDVIVTGTPEEMQKQAEEAQNTLVKTAQDAPGEKAEEKEKPGQTSGQEAGYEREQEPKPSASIPQTAEPDAFGTGRPPQKKRDSRTSRTLQTKQDSETSRPPKFSQTAERKAADAPARPDTARPDRFSNQKQATAFPQTSKERQTSKARHTPEPAGMPARRTLTEPASLSRPGETAEPDLSRTAKRTLKPEQEPATGQAAKLEQAPAAEPAPFTLPRRRERRPMTILDRPPGAENTPAKPAQPADNKFKKKESDRTDAKDPFSNITQEEYEAAVAPLVRSTWHFTLNDKPVTFPPKDGNAPYLLLDMLQHSGLDFDNLTAPVILAVNGLPGTFQQELNENDSIIIRQDE